MRELALHARRLAGSAHLRVLLNALSATDARTQHGQHDYGRRTALHMAMAARDIGFVETVLGGTDMRLRRAALRAVRTLPVPDEAASTVLDDAPLDLRLAFYRTLLHGRREALAETLLPEVHARWGDREAAVLLPACGGHTVSRWLPRLAHAVTSWTALGKRHPGAVLEAAHRELASGTPPWMWWHRRAAGAAHAAAAEPYRMLRLLEEHNLGPQAVRLPANVLTVLFTTDRARTAAMFTPGTLWDWNGPFPSVLRHLREYPESELIALAPGDAYSLRFLLRSLPPGRRNAVFDAVVQRTGGPTAMWSLHLLDVLPADRAAAEARRMLEWHASVWHSARSRLDDPELPLKLTAHLPYEEAAGPLREAAISGDPRRRGLARRLLLECAARTGDRTTLTAVLSDLAERTANEQDPLRGALLTALHDISPGLLDDACVAALESLAVHAVEARDSSPGTRAALRRLAGRMLRHHDPAKAPALTAWAMGAFEKLVARHGVAGLEPHKPEPQLTPTRRRRLRRQMPRPGGADRLDLVLRRGQEHGLLARLRPHLRAARERGDFSLAVALARVLGRRAWALDELQDDLGSAVRLAQEPVAREAAELWLASPYTREERVLGLVREEPAAIVLPHVWRTVAGRRTELLVPLLESAQGSRFSSSEWIPPVSGGMTGRWTPAQRDHVRELLSGVVEDARVAAASRVAAVTAVGRINASVDRLLTWAGHSDAVQAEAALEALAGCDAPAQALPTLLGHARGRVSPVAVAALAKCCRRVPPSLLGPALERVLVAPGGTVALRKLAVRQLERHRPPGAADLLIRVWEDPGLHRDVRVTVAGALRRMPEDPRALETLGAAADRYAGELMLRTLFQAHPMEYAPHVRGTYADLVLRLLMAADGPGVRFRGTKAFNTWAAWYRGDRHRLVGAVTDLGSRHEQTATQAFLALLSAGTIRFEALDVLARLVASIPSDGLDSSMATPAMTRTKEIAQTLARMHLSESPPEPWELRLSRDAVELLAAEPRLMPQAVLIAKAALPPPVGAHGDPSRLADSLCELAEMVRDRPLLAAGTAKALLPGRYHRRHVELAEPELLLPAVRRLLDQNHLAASLFALELIRAGGGQTGWAGEWRELLRELRASPDVELRQEAWDISVTEPP
ncbi:hypothetical protein ACFFHJ_25895 [Planotetraspora thailandica]|nr:hypothetical protein [Planotetraspora thailandica]